MMRFIKLLALMALTGLAPAGLSAARVETVQGFFREYALGPVGSGPAIVAVGEDDAVWTAMARSGQLARFSNGAVELFDFGADSRPVGLAIGTVRNGHPGKIWVAASYDNKLLCFDIATRDKKVYPIPGEESWPFNIALGPDGSVWFTQRASGRLGRLDPGTGEVKQYEPPTPNGGPAGLAVDPKTGTVWFTESYADRVARLDPTSGQIEEIAMSGSSTGQVSGPAGLALDPQGGVWFAKLEGKIGYIPPGEAQIELIDAPPEALRTAGLAVAPNRDVWALALDGNLLLRYRPASRTFTQFPLPTGQPDRLPAVPPLAKTARPFGIGIDRQGNVWFSEQYTGQLGVLDVAAPQAEILSPAGKVQTLRTPLTTRLSDRVAGIGHVHLTLDGQAVSPSQGFLDLAHLVPGRHTLEIRVEDAAGQSKTVVSAFEYVPGHLALQELIGRLEPLDADAAAARDRWIGIARTLPKGDARPLLASLQSEVLGSLASFREAPRNVLEAVFAFQVNNAGGNVEIKILDQAPYFQPQSVSVEKGDSVSWRYDPPSDGHSLPTTLHRIEIRTEDGVIQSTLLRAGEAFSHRFESPGRFTVRDTERMEAQGTVEVKGR